MQIGTDVTGRHIVLELQMLRAVRSFLQEATHGILAPRTLQRPTPERTALRV